MQADPPMPRQLLDGALFALRLPEKLSGMSSPETGMTEENVRCPYCKRPVTAKLEPPNVGRNGGDGGMAKHWMVYCEECDVWTNIPMFRLVEGAGDKK